jgi:hypothetical protein
MAAAACRYVSPKINQRSGIAFVADEPCQIAGYDDNGLKAGLGGGA